MSILSDIEVMLKDPESRWGRNTWRAMTAELMKQIGQITSLHPRDDWNEEDHDVIWYRLPIQEPPYIGTPNSSDWPEASNMEELESGDGLPPGYYTHWQRLPPVPKSAHTKASGGTHAD